MDNQNGQYRETCNIGYTRRRKTNKNTTQYVLDNTIRKGGVRVTRSLVLSVCFVDGCLSFCPFSFGHSVACSSSIYGF
jgi:hypothetical protein